MKHIFRTLFLFGALITSANKLVQAATTVPLNCGGHDDPCVYGENSFFFAAPHVVDDADSDFLKNNFATFDTFYFDVEGDNRNLRGSVTPSVPLNGFEGGIFDNDADVWRGRFVELDDDGTYTLIKTDAEGNFDTNMLDLDVFVPSLNIDGPDYHFHFYTNKDSGDPTA